MTGATAPAPVLRVHPAARALSGSDAADSLRADAVRHRSGDSHCRRNLPIAARRVPAQDSDPRAAARRGVRNAPRAAA